MISMPLAFLSPGDADHSHAVRRETAHPRHLFRPPGASPSMHASINVPPPPCLHDYAVICSAAQARLFMLHCCRSSPRPWGVRSPSTPKARRRRCASSTSPPPAHPFSSTPRTLTQPRRSCLRPHLSQTSTYPQLNMSSVSPVPSFQLTHATKP